MIHALFPEDGVVREYDTLDQLARVVAHRHMENIEGEVRPLNLSESDTIRVIALAREIIAPSPRR